MDWEREKAVSFRLGKEEGLTEGEQQKAVEAAIIAVKEFNATPEYAAQKMNAPLELVLESLKKQDSTRS